jgi:hypothetical protein
MKLWSGDQKHRNTTASWFVRVLPTLCIFNLYLVLVLVVSVVSWTIAQTIPLFLIGNQSESNTHPLFKGFHKRETIQTSEISCFESRRNTTTFLGSVAWAGSRHFNNQQFCWWTPQISNLQTQVVSGAMFCDHGTHLWTNFAGLLLNGPPMCVLAAQFVVSATSCTGVTSHCNIYLKLLLKGGEEICLKTCSASLHLNPLIRLTLFTYPSQKSLVNVFLGTLTNAWDFSMISTCWKELKIFELCIIIMQYWVSEIFHFSIFPVE